MFDPRNLWWPITPSSFNFACSKRDSAGAVRLWTEACWVHSSVGKQPGAPVSPPHSQPPSAHQSPPPTHGFTSSILTSCKKIPKNIKKIFYDLETPYGYGGPIANSNDREFINTGNEKFLEWVKDSNILAEFIRFHPLFNTNQYAHPSVKIIEDRTTCSLNLEWLNAIFI